MTTSNKQTKTPNTLGRMTTLGPREPWQVALLLPRGWDDMRSAIAEFSPDELTPRVGNTVVLQGRRASSPVVHYRPIPRTHCVLADTLDRTVEVTIFGNTGEAQKALRDSTNLAIKGKLATFRGKLQLTSAEIVHPAWVGRLRPRYPGKPSVIGAATVRDRVMTFLREALPDAMQYVVEQVTGGNQARFDEWLAQLAGEPVDLRQLLIQAHVPRDPQAGEAAQRILEQLSALAVALAARTERGRQCDARWQLPESATSWYGRVQGLPFEPNDDQQTAIGQILSDMRSRKPMHRLLTGDVGSGKTAVYAVAAAVAIDAGARVAILAPNTSLVRQITDNLQSWWPDLSIAEVTGTSSKGSPLAQHQLLIGSTALLHRKTGDLDLVIVDEQHKFSRGQREKLLQSGCHLLEATATCAPRSQALIELGVSNTSRLHTRPAADRNVLTRVWSGDQRKELMDSIEGSLAAGHQVLVIYPERGDAGIADNDRQKDKDAARKQASGAYKIWNRRFPGQVRLAHGGLSAEDKGSALDAMRERRARILVSTTVVEVGIDLPGLMRVTVINANRLGLMTLHQIRGRVARGGGTGHCDLFVSGTQSQMDDETPASERLAVLCETDDGFEIAERDMRLRGFGDLSAHSETQKGFLDGLLFQRRIRGEDMEAAITLLDEAENRLSDRTGADPRT